MILQNKTESVSVSCIFTKVGINNDINNINNGLFDLPFPVKPVIPLHLDKVDDPQCIWLKATCALSLSLSIHKHIKLGALEIQLFYFLL